MVSHVFLLVIVFVFVFFLYLYFAKSNRPPDCVDGFPHLPPCSWIHPGCRLVQQHYLWPVEKHICIFKKCITGFITSTSPLACVLPYLPIRARATLSFLLLPPLYCPQGLSKYWVRSTKLANFSSSLLIRFSELRRPRIRAKRVNISRPVNTLKKGEWGFCDENENEIDVILHILSIC